MKVELTEIRDVRPAGRLIRFFATPDAAIAHICNHLLTWPECSAWAILLGDRLGAVDVSDADERYRLAKAVVRGERETTQPLYDAYALAASQACDDARKLGWRAESRDDGERVEALGLTGLYVVSEPGHLVTAYLPGQARVDERIFESTPTAANPLPREGSLELPDWKAGRRDRQRRHRKAKAREWDMPDRLYYELFRPAVRDVRARVCDSFDVLGRRVSRASDLGKVLPRMSELKPDRWRYLWDRVSQRDDSAEQPARRPAEGGEQ
jgi:hypothetical protein